MNPVITAIPGSLIRAINEAKRPGDIDLGLGEPTLAPPLAPFEAATAWVREHGCPYSPNAGFGELREAIARCFNYPDLNSVSNVCVTVGSQEALYLAIKSLLNPATDSVLIVAPCYGAYAKLCALENLRHREVVLDAKTGFAPSAEAVLAALTPDTRLIILASPNNPTGRIWPRHELVKLADGLLARPGAPVYVLLDEVYLALHYQETPPTSLASLYPHTLVAGSLSKSHALTGLRLGWLMGTDHAITAAIKLHQFVNTAASTFSQRVAIAALQDPAGLTIHQPHYRQQRTLLLEQLQRHALPHIPPEGGFYVMLPLPDNVAHDSLAAARSLLESTRVVTIPGLAFGAEGFLRLSWVCSPEELITALERIALFFAEVEQHQRDIG